MADRFEKLFELPNNLYAVDSPVIVSAGSLLKDSLSGNIVVQLKFQSVSQAFIKAVSIDVAAYDIMGKEIEGKKNYQYLDLSIPNGASFGGNKAVIMPDSTTRSFDITNICVVLSDGSTSMVQIPLSALAKKTPLTHALQDDELIKQYRLSTCDRASFVPVEEKDLWQCTCGTWNRGSSCIQCRTSKHNVFSSYNIDLLREASAARLSVEAEEKKMLERETYANENRLASKRASHLLITTKIFCVLAMLAEAIIMLVGYEDSNAALLCGSAFSAVSFLLLLFSIGRKAVLSQVAFVGLAVGEIFYAQSGADFAPFLCNAAIWILLFFAFFKKMKSVLIRIMPMVILAAFIKPLWILYIAEDFWVLPFFGLGSVVMSMSSGWLLFSTKSGQGEHLINADEKKLNAKKNLMILVGIPFVITGGLFLAAGFIPNLQTDGLTIRVLSILIWNTAAIIFGMRWICKTRRSSKIVLFEKADIVTIAIGILSFAVFYYITYIK